MRAMCYDAEMSEAIGKLGVTDCAECDPAGPTCARCVTLLEQESEITRLRELLRGAAAPGPVVRVRRVSASDLPLPAYATAGAAGMDLRADFSEYTPVWGQIIGTTGRSGDGPLRSITLRTDGRALIPCGFAFEIPDGYEGQVRGRSSLTKRGIYCPTGTIDCDYRGEVAVYIDNRSGEPFVIEHGARIAQMVIALAPRVTLEEVEELTTTERGMSGFGSTGAR